MGTHLKVARIYRGWTTVENADTCQAIAETEVFPVRTLRLSGTWQTRGRRSTKRDLWSSLNQAAMQPELLPNHWLVRHVWMGRKGSCGPNGTEPNRSGWSGWASRSMVTEMDERPQVERWVHGHPP